MIGSTDSLVPSFGRHAVSVLLVLVSGFAALGQSRFDSRIINLEAATIGIDFVHTAGRVQHEMSIILNSYIFA